jgi:hypothetical protein
MFLRAASQRWLLTSTPMEIERGHAAMNTATALLEGRASHES